MGVEGSPLFWDALLSSIQQAHRSRDCKITDFDSQKYQNKIYIMIYIYIDILDFGHVCITNITTFYR